MKQFAALLFLLCIIPLSAADDTDDIIRIIKEPGKSTDSQNDLSIREPEDPDTKKTEKGQFRLIQEDDGNTNSSDTEEETQQATPQQQENEQQGQQQAAPAQPAPSSEEIPRQRVQQTDAQPQESPMQPPSPMSSDAVLLESGISLYNSGNYEAAIETLRELRNTFPSSQLADQANMWIAKSYFRLGNTNDGLEALELIPQRSGEYPAALYLAGTNYLSLKEYTRAKRSFYRATSLFPAHDIADDALLELCKLYLSEGNGEEALKSAVYIMKNYSDRESADDALFMMGRIYEQDPRLKDIEKARQIYTLFIKRADSGEAPYASSPLREKVISNLAFINENYFAAE